MWSAVIRRLLLGITLLLLGGCSQAFVFCNQCPLNTECTTLIRAPTIAATAASRNEQREQIFGRMAGRGVMRSTTTLLMFDSSSPDSNEDEPPLPSVTDPMGNANVQRSSSMGPSMQPKEDKLREKAEKEKLEMMKPKQNKWATGAFKRGVALQVAVLAIIVFLQLKPAEVSTLAVCAPFTHGPGCVSFGEWLAIVILGAPVPIV